MKSIFKYIALGVVLTFVSACLNVESELQSQVDEIKERIQQLQGRITALNGQLTSLNHIVSGNVITAVSQDSDGKYVITYLDNSNEEKTVVLATIDQMINVPLLGVEKDAENGLYYWTVTANGETTYLMDGAKKVPVSGYVPEISVDAEGYWTVNGQRLNDPASGNPIEANDGETCVFKDIQVNSSGDLEVTQGNGTVITIPVQQAMNLSLSATINTSIPEVTTYMDITYEVTGTSAKDAMVALAEVSGVEATIDRDNSLIKVTFPGGFDSGYIIVVAYDLAEHTVLRPVFFEKTTSTTIEIRSAEDLVQLAAAVNAATGAETMDVLLMNDIDMSSVTKWTPIGNGHFHGSVSAGDKNHQARYTGAAFKGTFDGQGHSIKNIKLNATLTANETVYGLFGILDGATVKNLTLGTEGGDESILNFSAADSTDVAVLAGAVMASTIENCVNYVPMQTSGSTQDNVRVTMGAFGGFVYASADAGSTLKGLVNHGSITVAGGSNTKNGASSVMAAGIAGMTNGMNGITTRNYVYNCENYGDITSSVARSSGIIAAINQFTNVELCKNYGDQVNSNSGTRVGMISAIMGPYTSLKDCENHGDATMTGGTSAQVGGLICLLNATSATIDGGGNYGTIISDITTYRGTLVANFSNFASVSNVVAGGAIGSYNEGTPVMETITADNYMSYIGRYSAANATKITNITFYGEGMPNGIYTAADLVEFAAAVNAGESIAKWQDESGGVNMYANIDMASVSDWTPIGNATCSAGPTDAAITGNAWTGNFNGNGRRISNLKLVSDGTEAGENYGFFGVLAPGAVVQNLIFDASCSLEVTATASLSTGVVAGYVFDATVRDVTSYASMTFKGKQGSSKYMGMAMIGQVYCSTKGVIIDSCHNFGEIIAENLDNNTQGGANAYHIAGIVAFAHAHDDATAVNTISDCSNYGNMTSATARTSGIVAAANRRTNLVNCVNHGDQFNTFSGNGNGRLGNITCNAGSNVTLTGCVNYGDLTSTGSARAGGITSLSNTCTFENCANYGIILTDSQYRGVFWAYNSAVATWRNCTAGGQVGTYNSGSPVYDSYEAGSEEKYLGVANSSVETVFENITYLIGTTNPSTGTDGAELSILFIGNSFTKDAVEHLPGVLAAAGLDKVHLTHMYYGGRLVSEYYAGWSTSTDYRRYECTPGSTVWTETTGYSLEDVAASRSWDIVTIQEHTGNAAAWLWNSTAQSNLQGLVNNIKATQTGVMPKFYYILSQAYYDMNKIGTGSRPSITWTDQAGMWEVIAAFGKSVMKNVSFDGIISTGVMLQNLRTSSLDNEMNLTRDGYHMDYGIARYGATCTVFETLITPKFSVNMDSNSYRYSVSSTSTSSYSTPVTDANAPVALQAARYAISNPYTVTDMAGQ